MKDASANLKHIREAIAKIEKCTIARDLISRHDLTDDEYEKIIEVSEYELNLMGRLR